MQKFWSDKIFYFNILYSWDETSANQLIQNLIEADRRICYDWVEFGRLSYIFRSPIPELENWGIQRTRATSYVMICGVKTWSKVEVAHHATERVMFQISLTDHIHNEVIPQRTEVTDIVCIISKLKLQCGGYVCKRTDGRSCRLGLQVKANIG